MPRLGQLHTIYLNTAAYRLIGSCSIPGCDGVFLIEGCAECNRCRRVFCEDHELKSFIHPDSSDSSSTDSDDAHSAGLGCVMCCRSPRYADIRVFDDAAVITKLLSLLVEKKTRLEVEEELRDTIRGCPKPKAKTKNKAKEKTTSSMFEALRTT